MRTRAAGEGGRALHHGGVRSCGPRAVVNRSAALCDLEGATTQNRAICSRGAVATPAALGSRWQAMGIRCLVYGCGDKFVVNDVFAGKAEVRAGQYGTHVAAPTGHLDDVLVAPP